MLSYSLVSPNFLLTISWEHKTMLRKLMVAMAAGLLVASTAPAHADDEDGRGSRCTLSALVVSKVQNQLLPVTQLADQNGGLFKPNRMWSAVVDREGHLCSIIKPTLQTAMPGRGAERSRSPRPRLQTTSATARSLCLRRTYMDPHSRTDRFTG